MHRAMDGMPISGQCGRAPQPYRHDHTHRRWWMSGAVAAAVSLPILAAPQAANAQFIRDTEIEQLMADYSRPIFREAGLGGDRISMRIVNSPAFNAFVVDGRNVFMNSGALMQAETPNEVIGVIAHETGHITGGHLAQLRTKIRRDRSRDLLLQILGIGALAAGAAGGSDGAVGAGQALIYGGAAASQRSTLIYRQGQESSADQAALKFLRRTKQSARGMLITFERFAQNELFSERFQDPYLRSHPMPAQRIAQLRDGAARSPYFDKRDKPSLQLRHDLMRAKLSGYIERRGALQRYPSSDQSLPARYARAIGTFFTSGIDAALPLIDNLIRSKPDYPYFQELRGELLLRAARPREAVGPLRKAHKATNRSPLIGMRLATALVAIGSRDAAKEAVKLLRPALDGDPFSAGYQQLAKAYGILGDIPRGQLAAAEAARLTGNMRQAKLQAGRAQQKFPENSREWLKAYDILNTK